MKKFFLATCCALCLALGAKAQSYTVWYGLNSASVSYDGGSSDSEIKPLNIGVSYTTPLTEAIDLSAGVGYVSKGGKDWTPGLIQIEGTGAYNFMKNDNIKLNAFTGPTLGTFIAKDDAEDLSTICVGWQLGLGATISNKYVVKLGYELGLTDAAKDYKSKMNALFVRVGYNF